MARITVATVNAALKRAGFKERIVNGGGYFYWTNLDWESVYVASANDLSIEEWLKYAIDNKDREGKHELKSDLTY